MQRNNRSGINGLRLYMDTSKGQPPTLHVQASWARDGRVCSTHYSTRSNGCLGATQKALQAREAGTGQPMGLTARQAWARMQASYRRVMATGR